jgi:excisionase family DNA binding protein
VAQTPPTQPQATSTGQQLVSQGLVTVQEAAEFLGLSRSKIYQLMDQGRLPYAKIDSARRIPRQALNDFAAHHLVWAPAGPVAV